MSVGSATHSPSTQGHHCAHIRSMDEETERKIKVEFGRRLRSMRKRKGLSQETLALSCDLDRTYIGSVERGERNISLINICKIAEALGVTADSLFVD